MQKVCVSHNMVVSIQKFPLVSVIILNWNQKDYLKRCLNSVLKTDYPFLEIIVSDNGSTDGTKRWIKESIEKRIVDGIFFNNPENVGTAVARNEGLKKINSTMVALSDDDMWYDKNCFEYSVEVKESKHSNILGTDFGTGKNPNEAIAQYVENIKGKWLVIDASNNEKRREFGVPSTLTS